MKPKTERYFYIYRSVLKLINEVESTDFKIFLRTKPPQYERRLPMVNYTRVKIVEVPEIPRAKARRK